MSGIQFYRNRGGTLTRVGEVDFLEPNLNLLAHAQAIELDVGSRCGGHGICGGDRLRILTSNSDVSPITEVERSHLSGDEIKRGLRLGCQTFPNRSDTIIEAEVDL
jgi:ferredoxin